MMKQLPPFAEVTSRLEYDPSSGSFRWKQATKGHAVGSVAGYKKTKGYIVIMMNGKNYMAHRLAWLISAGTDPGGSQIDHINANKADNRIENLRLSDNSKNHANVGLRKDNKTGFKGVHFVAHINKWEARLQNNVIGYFETAPAAAQAYDERAVEVFGEHARLNTVSC